MSVCRELFAEHGTAELEQNTVSQVLQLSLQEEAIRQKLEQTNATIEQLMKVRQQVTSELDTERADTLKAATHGGRNNA